MKILRDLADARAACHRVGAQGRLGLVPTMGALHEGHLSIVHRARAECDAVAVTIFVNPLQFGEPHDLERYPRPEAQDCALLEAQGVDLALLLPPGQMYPPGFATRVTQDRLTTVLEGAARPGHFDGVLTVVAKLFGLAGPCTAYFGRKDYQQTVVVRRMVADLELPAEVVVCDTIRDADGLALSSRNVFLSPDERRRGLSLVAALARVQERFEAGETSGARLTGILLDTLRRGLGHAPEYAALVDPDDLSPVSRASAGQVAVVAGRVGATRLIDNHVLGARISGFSPGAEPCSVS